MQEQASLSEWKRLYELAIEYKNLKPWQHICEADHILLKPFKNDIICACSVLGYERIDCRGAAIYIGDNAVQDYFDFIDRVDIPNYQNFRFQSYIAVYFGSRDETTPRDRQIIDMLGYKFRGRNNWIYFRKYDKIFAPSELKRNEVLDMITSLAELNELLKAYIQEEVSVDFEEDEILMREYNNDNNSWINYGTKFEVPGAYYKIYDMDNELEKRRLKKKKSSFSVIEADVIYLPTIINDDRFEGPILPRVLTVVDEKREYIIEQYLLKPSDNYLEILFKIIVNYIISNEKPKKIIFRNFEAMFAFEDFLRELGIITEVKDELIAIDKITEDMLERFC